MEPRTHLAAAADVDGVTPRFESLEDRLLLTTIDENDFFIYRNSQEQAIRIQLIGPGQADVYGLWDPTNIIGEWGTPQLFDLPGVYGAWFSGDRNDPANLMANGIAQPDGELVLEYTTDPGPPPETTLDGWMPYEEGVTRGAYNEIYAIYLSGTDATTRLIIAPLAESDIADPDFNPDFLAPWDGDVPILMPGAEPWLAPDDSGPVLIGAVDAPPAAPGDPVAYAAIDEGNMVVDNGTTQFVRTFYDGPQTGPTLYPGINIAGGGAGTNTRVGRIKIAGTVAGVVAHAPDGTGGTASVDEIEMGFLWGGFELDGNLGRLLSYYGGGGIVIPDTTPTAYYGPDLSLVRTYGAIGNVVSVDPDALWFSGVQADAHPSVELPWLTSNGTYVIPEYEHQYDPAVDEGGFYSHSWHWLQGNIVDYGNDVDNAPGNFDNAYFLSHPTGTFTFTGQLNRWTFMPDDYDYYALPLLAGQTVTINAGTFGGQYGSLNLLSVDGRLMAQYGTETADDRGVPGRGSGFGPIVFTAPEAGIYYLELVLGTSVTNASYSVSVTNGTDAYLGSVHLHGNFTTDHAGAQDGAAPNPPVTGFTGRSDPMWNAGAANISTKNGGNIGAVLVQGMTYGLDIQTFGGGHMTTPGRGGDLYAFQADTVGPPVTTGQPSTNTITTAGSIGSVRTTAEAGEGFLRAIITAGTENINATIYNVWVAGDMHAQTEIYSSGSIGIVEIMGMAWGFVLDANYDRVGPGGMVDLIQVAGDWGGLQQGYPALSHGPGGDIGFIHIGGDIYLAGPAWSGSVTVTGSDDGTPIVISDDSGGRLLIEPGVINPGLVPFEPHWTQRQQQLPGVGPLYTAVRAYVIPVDGGVGGVLARLEIDGPATLTTQGTSQISVLDLSLAGASTNLLIQGDLPDDRVDVYNIQGSFNSLVSRTEGNLFSGTLGAIPTIDWAGDIGNRQGRTRNGLRPGAELYGITPGTSVAQGLLGWHHDRLNGLQVGSLATLRVGGSLGDLYVTGLLGNARVNADGWTEYGEWDGVKGVVFAGGGIGSIDVGDGLMDDGTGERYMAAILALPQAATPTNPTPPAIGTVTISGPYDQVTLEDGRVLTFGELNGSILATGDILAVVGTNGASLTGVVGAASLTSGLVTGGTTFTVGIGVHRVDFSGPDARIYRAEIMGGFVGTVRTSTDSQGIRQSYISGLRPSMNRPGIAQIIAGGWGMIDTVVQTRGGDIGTIQAEGAGADIRSNTIQTNMGLRVLQGRDISNNSFSVAGTIGRLTTTRDFASNNGAIGGLGSASIGRDWAGGTMTVGDGISTILIGRDFDATLVLSGGQTANLGLMRAMRDIRGTIWSAARLGQIIALQGGIYANISTSRDGWNANLDLLQAQTGIFGNIEVGGNLGRVWSAGDVGVNPDLEGGLFNRTQRWNIWGNLGSLMITGAASDLFADINVGGDVGSMMVADTFFSRMAVNGNINSFVVGKAFGGTLPTLGQRGSLQVLGSINALRIPANADFNAPLTTGGSITNIYLNNANLLQPITSLYGSIGTVTVVNGNIAAPLNAQRIGQITVHNGNITGAISTGDAARPLTTGGDIGGLTVINGLLDADVTAHNGRINLLNLINASTAAGRTITADNGVGSAVVRNGAFNADLVSGREIRSLTVLGGPAAGAGDLTGDVSAATGIGNLNVSGTVSGDVRSDGAIDLLTAGAINGSTVSAAWNIGTVTVRGDMTSAMLLAGIRPGLDGVVGTADDTARQGSINFLNILGAFDGSIVSAGVAPGADGDFLTTTGAGTANIEGAGTSSVRTMRVGSFANNAASAVLADTSIDARLLAQLDAEGIVNQHGSTESAAGVGTAFGRDAGQVTVTVNGLTLTLIGPGLGIFDAVANKIILNHTTSATTLLVRYSGAAPFGTVSIVAAEDDALAALTVIGNVTVGDVDLDGGIGAVNIGDIADGSTWNVPGGIRTAIVGRMPNVTVNTGEVLLWRTAGSYEPVAGDNASNDLDTGSFNADSIGTFLSMDRWDADINTAMGPARVVQVLRGGLRGNVTARGDILSLYVLNTGVVGAGIEGDVTVTHGDLGSVYTNGNLEGETWVQRGLARSVYAAGSFAGTGTFRTRGGVTSFVVGNAFAGLLSTLGDLRVLSVTNAMTGKAWSGGTLYSAIFGSMSGGLVAASGDLYNAYVRGNMTSSYLLAGLDLGDDPAGNDAANLQIDAHTIAAGLPVVEDQAGVGRIYSVTVVGSMVASSIAAGIDPGVDGFFGNYDDTVNGVGHIGRVVVTRTIRGSNIAGESHAIVAANSLPYVLANGRPFQRNGNMVVRSMATAAGPLSVTDMRITSSGFIFRLHHMIDLSTLAANVELYISADDVFTADELFDLTGNGTLTFNPDTFEVTYTLTNDTWTSLGIANQHLRLQVVDGLMDNRGNQLDGEWFDVLPTGDGVGGGNFVFEMVYGLSTMMGLVPAYTWWFGCTPTAAGMLAGYYDAHGYNGNDYSNLIDGNALNWPGNAAIREAIASYDGAAFLTDPDTGNFAGWVPGSEPAAGGSHAADYGVYRGDEWAVEGPGNIVPDLSEEWVQQRDGVTPHDDDSLADFLGTSRSAIGASYGNTRVIDVAGGIEDYFDHRGYEAEASSVPVPVLTWELFIHELESGRPVMLGTVVPGGGGHSILAVGYDAAARQIQFWSTWNTDLYTATVDPGGFSGFTVPNTALPGDPPTPGAGHWTILDATIVQVA